MRTVAGRACLKTAPATSPYMAVERLDLRRYHADPSLKHAEDAQARDTSAKWNNDIQRMHTTIHNVLLLHSRDYSVRAISEDLDLPKSSVQRIIQNWRTGKRIPA